MIAMKQTIATLIAITAASPALAASKPFFSLKNTDFVVMLGFLVFIGILLVTGLWTQFTIWLRIWLPGFETAL